MAGFEVGQRVNVPCDIHPGAFPGEYLVTFETRDGTFSGFVRTEHVVKTHETTGHIHGIIKAVEEEAVTVQLPGSFFTTAAGLTSFPTSWANENVTVLTKGPVLHSLYA